MLSSVFEFHRMPCSRKGVMLTPIGPISFKTMYWELAYVPGPAVHTWTINARHTCPTDPTFRACALTWRTYCPPVLLVDVPPFAVFNQILLLYSVKVDSESMMISFRLKLTERSSAAAFNNLWRAPLGGAVETVSPPSPRALVFGTFLKAQLWTSCKWANSAPSAECPASGALRHENAYTSYLDSLIRFSVSQKARKSKLIKKSARD